ncbi:DUF1444 domain-containing protein [Bacillus sp. 2205SS5-2]|uniref:DUF1444 domain-containing protein n=1 Tax=Bacillus sp. 2205SS5-2 TaxID=3109031 RepID=UPI003003BF47
MDTQKMKNLLIEKLSNADRLISYDREKDTLRIENKETKKGITISLPGVVGRYNEKKEKAVEEMVYYVNEALEVMGKDVTLNEKEKNIFPVIRSTSFPKNSSEGHPLVNDDHTAETRIYYALDLGSSYRLIDQKWLAKESWTEEKVREVAQFNVRSLSTPVKKDEVAGNIFYFLHAKDGYDASRILNDAFLRKVSEDIEGEMTVSVPHQDVLIIGDMRNETGYDVLAQMTMSFFSSGPVPITALSFVYDDGELEPIFILGKNKKK